MPPRGPNKGGTGTGGAARGSSPARGGPARGGGGRGASGPPRGVPQQRGGQPARQGAAQAAPTIAAHVQTVAVKRPGYGAAGQHIKILVNAALVLNVPDCKIYHYDVVIGKESGATVNQRIIKVLQEEHQDIFTPKAAYDGRKNLFAPGKLKLGEQDARTFQVALDPPRPGATRAPKTISVKLTLVATLNAALLERFVNGQQSMNNEILTTINALNVAIRMYPIARYPFNARSFFSNQETRTLGKGLEVWRGYFQSLRPSVGRLFINVDISSALMYRPGPLVPISLEALDSPANQTAVLTANLDRQKRQKLSKFLRGVRVEYGKKNDTRKGGIQGLSDKGANQEMFTDANGKSQSVAQYIQTTYNIRLQFPALLCVRLGKTALVPMELCTILPGQIYRKDVPPETQDAFRDFSTKKPQERLNSIRNGMNEFGYGQSEYVRAFGLNVDSASMPMNITARILPAPGLQYGAGSREKDSNPRQGAWNLIDKKFIAPETIKDWCIAVFESPNRFRADQAAAAGQAIVNSCQAVGMRVLNPNPIIQPCNPHQDVSDQLRRLGARCMQERKSPPNVIFVIIPPTGNQQLYKSVKYFGEVQMGVVTQVLQSTKVAKAREQYWANVLLKLNVKLGGINHTLKPSPVTSLLNDPKSPVIIMGADTIHPSPGADSHERPSFTALVSSVNVAGTKYIARESVQQGRVEIIQDLKEMAKSTLTATLAYLRLVDKAGIAPTRLFFFRDGVGEGQFEEVKEKEVKMLREACAEMKLKIRITFIVVGKRHHIRLFATDDRNTDRSGNLVAGTVVDRDITHPTDFDYYLQSHGGLLGTSRSSHYTVLEDDNNMNADNIQSLSYALCHVYARSTRSVSIPAPVYYADIVAARAKLHFDPNISLSDTASMTTAGGGPNLSPDELVRGFKQGLKPLHVAHTKLMYFQ